MVDATGQTILINDHFFEILPSLLDYNVLPSHGVEEIIFADGTVWDRITIAVKVAHTDDASTSITGTDQMDFLEGGKGNDTLIGGNNSDIYVFGKDYDQDKADDRKRPCVNKEFAATQVQLATERLLIRPASRPRHQGLHQDEVSTWQVR